MAYKITITQDGIGGADVPGVAQVPRGSENEPGKPKQVNANLNALLIDYGKTLMTEGFNTFVNITGDTLLQERVATGLGIAADVLMIAKGGLVGVGAVAVKYGTAALNGWIERDRNMYQTNILKQQAGKVIELGGRYTND